MSGDKRMTPKDNPSFVTKDLCDERFNRIMDSLKVTNKKLDELIDAKKEESHALRNAVIAALSGIVTAAVTWFLSASA